MRRFTFNRPAVACALACALVATSSCVDKDKGNKVRKDPAYIKANLLPTAPAKLANKVNATLGDKVVYLGNDVKSKVIKPGEDVTITHYWKVVAPPGKGWRVFTHVNGAKSQDWMNVDATKMRAQYPPKDWKAGDIIRDEQKFKLKKDWVSPFALVSVGLFSGNAVKDRMAITKGPKDKQHRVPVLRFKVAASGSAGDVAKNVLKKAPKFDNKVGTNFGGKLIYLGNDAPASVRAGEPISIIHYWKVVAPPEGNWSVRSMLEGTSPRDRMSAHGSPMRRAYPSTKWKAGDIIRDTQKIVLRRSWASTTAKVRIGVFDRKQRKNVAITAGPKVDDNWAEVASIEVKFNVIPKAKGPIKLDGVADEESWKTALASPNFVDAKNGPSTQMTKARLLWDDEALYVFVEVSDTNIRSKYTKRDDPLWKGDVVELFIDADRNGNDYVELQVNPNNAVFDAWFARRRSKQYTGEFDWNSKLESKVVVNGTVNKSDKDTGWNVEIKIPHATVKGRNDKMRVNIPPKVGDRWRLNIIRVDRDGKKYEGISSWNQITSGDFHALRLMLEVVFGDEKGEFAPPAPPAPAPGKKTGEAGSNKKAAPGKTVDPKVTKPKAGLKRRIKIPFKKRAPAPAKKPN